jgi:aminoglycoside phosphotransferase (APT) family kinase protein/tetratricopeptide (TPR) repeat protein
MPLKPRFQRAGGSRRPFVDREHAIEAFDEELRRTDTAPRVLNITGIGGIGKSRLLREFRARVAASHRTALLDLQVPAWREQEAALAVLRRELGTQGVRFDRYDLAYAVLWQRLHPHLRLDRKQLPLIDNSEVLGKIIDDAAGLPVFATAVGLTKLLHGAPEKFRKWRWVRNDPTLAELDELSNTELTDAVTYLFAEDLRLATEAGTPYAIFVDAYEALVVGTQRAGQAAATDAWLRDLVVQLDAGLTVIASREPLRWSDYDTEWSRAIRLFPVDDLPERARLELLADGGVLDERQRAAIAEASAGVPFYLNLALDTLQRPGAESAAVVVSPAEILERFLQHVDPQDVRFLELLSVARTFDYEIFQAVARAYQLPANRMVWESLTAYSFVNPAGPARFQLHQLMVTAMQGRMSPELAAEVHRLLHAAWAGRVDAAETHGNDSAGPDIVTAVREAVYHALHAGEIDGPELLRQTDRILAAGATLGISGIVADVEDAITDAAADGVGAAEGNLAKAVRCLRVEAAVRQGDAPGAAALTSDAGTGSSSLTDARLSVAGAHARRILGETNEALRIYTAVWDRQDSPQRGVAGLWAADLHMAQGRFAEAVRMAGLVREFCCADDAELLGGVNRLLYLAYRFSFDFPAAAKMLDEAEQAYTVAGSAIGLANIAVNRAELLAWTDPAAAVSAADKAVELQEEVGATHEIGKAYTAMALAQTTLGEHDRADAALTLACEALERAGYRSGRARAELVRAVLAARQGQTDAAERSARWAIGEFQQVEVYPTFILTGQALLELLGRSDAAVATAAASARRAIHPVGALLDLERRMWRRIATLVGHFSDSQTLAGSAPLSLYVRARTGDAPSAGFYNDNLRLDTQDGPVIVRIPLAGADEMDLRVWPEQQVLRAIAPYVDHVPRLLHSSSAPAFQIHEYIPGELLDNVAPRGTRVPPFVLDDVVQLFGQLVTVPLAEVPPPPHGWPADGDSASFAALLSDVTAGVWDRFRDEYGPLYAALGVPPDPLAPAVRGWTHLSSRPFRLLHCDVHRKNIIVNQGGSTFLDWELALCGDPVYDLAVHLHKMSYQDDERQKVVHGWLQALPGELTDGWEPDLETYLVHERIKSALVDTVRYAKIVAERSAPEEHQQRLIASLTGKLNAAGAVWGWRTRIDAPTVARVLGCDARP